MKRILRDNGLSLVLMALFALTMIGQTLAGWREHNKDQQEHHQPTVTLGKYFATGHFWEATAENWESEFLQMCMFVLLTVWFVQKGSPESKSPDGEEAVDDDPRKHQDSPNAPWPVRKGGWALWVYSHSLSIAFATMFLISIAIHAVAGAKEHSEENQAHGQPSMSVGQYIVSSAFWFESFQNWQSEFLSLAGMVYLSVYLRERGSAESKPVATPHDRQD
ncbi:MAG TPA: DUF6766 family protein [Tepidisphaeraceae bacterium]|jgi:hypothetical protein